MKLLIIGCNGFIGNYAYHFFMHDNENTVVGADIFNEYTKTNFHLLPTHDDAFVELFEKKYFDCCINASGMANVAFSAKNPFADYTANVYNNAKILDALRKYNPKCKYIHLSSAAVYGNPENLPISEDTPTKPISIYGYHKLQSELLCSEYSQIFNIPTINLRLFSVFGEGLKKQLFWDVYHKMLESNSTISLFGNPIDSRDFIYIADLMQVFKNVITSADFNGQSINVANGDEVIIKNIITDFFEICNCTKPFVFSNENLPGYPSRWVANISKLQSLGYTPSVSMKQGLKNYYSWLIEKQ